MDDDDLDEAYPESVSGHLRFADRDAVVQAIFRLGLSRGAPVPVWPPARLPRGIFVSPPRNGWVSLWSQSDDLPEWFPALSETLECAGVLLQVTGEQYWGAEFLQDGRLLHRYVLPTAYVEWDLLMSHLADAGFADAWKHFGPDDELPEELARIRDGAPYHDALEELRRLRPTADDLRAFLPQYAKTELAWEALTAIDDAEEQEPDAFLGDFVERFASYLGIQDATWNPEDDVEALAEGDYDEDELLPEPWKDFVVLPLLRLPMLH